MYDKTNAACGPVSTPSKAFLVTGLDDLRCSIDRINGSNQQLECLLNRLVGPRPAEVSPIKQEKTSGILEEIKCTTDELANAANQLERITVLLNKLA